MRQIPIVLVLALGCSTPEEAPPPIDPGDPNHPFLHEEQVRDVLADGNQLPPTLSVQMHACGKISYETLGTILRSRGVNIDNMAPDSAGQLYRGGNLMLGAPVYEARVSEALRSTTGGLTRLSDILLAAAPEIIANLPAREECKVNGVGARLFDEQGCNALGIACLIGAPPPDRVVALCNEMLSRVPAQNRATAQRLAVAAIASAFYLCE
jgi:hypothetical protein